MFGKIRKFISGDTGLRRGYVDKLLTFVFALRFVRFFYRSLLRPLCPRNRIILAGIETGECRMIFDKFLVNHGGPWTFDNPDYEAGLVTGIHEFCRKGDRIVIIGGGVGVTCVIGARTAGESGSVICYEGSWRQIERIKETALINRVANVDIVHGIVGENMGVYGDVGSHGELVSAKNLPDCDMLEMDCEGAEGMILDQMNIRPRVILVETHGHLGTPSHLIRNKLEILGYSVSDLGVAEPCVSSFCEKNDVRVLAAKRSTTANSLSKNPSPIESSE